MSADGKLGAKAQIDFHCLDSENCNGVVKFNLAEICDEDFQAVCPKCHRAYELDEALRNMEKTLREQVDPAINVVEA